MKYIIQADVDPETGTELEANPQNIQEMIGAWQAVNPIGMYFSLSARRLTIILEADNEDAFFEPLHKTWVATNSYPEVWPVADAEEFPQFMRRLGLT